MDSEIIHCKLCGSEFTTTKPNKIFCTSKCQQKHYSDNRDKLKVKRYKKEWTNNNKDKIAISAKRARDKQKQDPIQMSIKRLRNRMNSFLKTVNFKKTSHIKDVIGCSPMELQSHLDKTFIDNYGREYTEDDNIHIDHIVPLVTAKSIDDVNRLNHYTNLQYLLAEDNLIKGANHG